MQIKTKNSTVNIPTWFLALGLLVADNIVCNACRLKALGKVTKETKQETSEEGES